MRWPRGRVASFLTGLLVGIAIVVAVVAVAPTLTGWRTLTVMSGSMEPAISTGDLVVTRPVAAASVRAGTVVTFRDPSGRDRLITHRVQRAVVEAGSVQVTTRGDANNASEQWRTARGGRVGVVQYRVRGIGFAFAALSTPVARIALIAIPLLVWGILTLVSTWRPAPAPTDLGAVAHA